VSATVEIRRAADRAVTTTSWLQSRHSFSFGDHYDPANTHHGVLLVSNDDVLAPAAGFDTHPHRDMEIVTWVLEGSLAHRDSAGNSGVIYPGLAQRMSAGAGITHSEKNASDTEPVRFVQMWVPPDESGVEPGYQQQAVEDDQLEGRLMTIGRVACCSVARRCRARTAGGAVSAPVCRPGAGELRRGRARRRRRGPDHRVEWGNSHCRRGR
jgi:redox-sensitive bicupin YhaK (pirin superfamily)